MAQARFITAIGTPLTDDDQLHSQALAQQLDSQADAGIDSILVAGTMGIMPLLSDQTWRDLVTQSVQLNSGRFEMLVGGTDLSTGRVLDRIAFLNKIDGIDGVVIMVPGMFRFTQDQFIDYFQDIAQASRYPIYLYDLEPLTGMHLSVGTIVTLAKHPNIKGIKLSANVPEAVRVKNHLEGTFFRLIIAEPIISDMLFRHGYAEHLDGIYSLAPHWATALSKAANEDDWKKAAVYQKKLTQIKELFLTLSTWDTFAGIMNLRGFPGKYAPKPLPLPTEASLAHLRQIPIIQELLTSSTAPGPGPAPGRPVPVKV